MATDTSAKIGAPDFERLARGIAAWATETTDLIDTDDRIAGIANELRLLWNARGTADLAVIDDVAHTNDVAVANAIRRLDRLS